MADARNLDPWPEVEVAVPPFTVLQTDLFERFLDRNGLRPLIDSAPGDEAIATAFQQASLPPGLAAELRPLVRRAGVPLAVRSSSLLEEALQRPFGGVYRTKMIPNVQADADRRLAELVDAIKFVYASTFFERARAAGARYATPDRMAVVIQEGVGLRHGDRFYPDVSGVVRSHNFYPRDGARSEDGLVLLALGLGKTIADGGSVWAYSPSRPRALPPYGSVAELLQRSQTTFWAVNLGRPLASAPMAEAEYLALADLTDAEQDGTLRRVASTYDARSDRLVPGIGLSGPRAVTFAPLLVLEERPLDRVLQAVFNAVRAAGEGMIEVEFAATIPPDGRPSRLGILQARPLVDPEQLVEISDVETPDAWTLVMSRTVLGNGIRDDLADIVYVRPQFDPAKSREVASEVARLNRHLLERRRPYILISFGRWGSVDPRLGIPVTWAEISGARVIVEAAGPALNVEASLGSHFFHSVSTFEVPYFAVNPERGERIDWAWLEGQPGESETERVRHLHVSDAFGVAVDGRTGCGTIRRPR